MSKSGTIHSFRLEELCIDADVPAGQQANVRVPQSGPVQIVELSHRLGEDHRLILVAPADPVRRLPEITQLPTILQNLDVIERRLGQALQ